MKKHTNKPKIKKAYLKNPTNPDSADATTRTRQISNTASAAWPSFRPSTSLDKLQDRIFLHHLWRADPEALLRAAEALLLPLPSLLARLGPEGLSHRLDQVLRAQSRSLRVAYGLMPAPEGYPRALELLGEWPGARPLLLRHLCDFEVAPELRRDLVQRLWRSDRATALRWGTSFGPR